MMVPVIDSKLAVMSGLKKRDLEYLKPMDSFVHDEN